MSAVNDQKREDQFLDALIVAGLQQGMLKPSCSVEIASTEPALTAEEIRALDALGPDLVDRIVTGARKEPLSPVIPRAKKNPAAANIVCLSHHGDAHDLASPVELFNTAQERAWKVVNEWVSEASVPPSLYYTCSSRQRLEDRLRRLLIRSYFQPRDVEAIGDAGKDERRGATLAAGACWHTFQAWCLEPSPFHDIWWEMVHRVAEIFLVSPYNKVRITRVVFASISGKRYLADVTGDTNAASPSELNCKLDAVGPLTKEIGEAVVAYFREWSPLATAERERGFFDASVCGGKNATIFNKRWTRPFESRDKSEDTR